MDGKKDEGGLRGDRAEARGNVRTYLLYCIIV